jgi:DNA adenine methylase
MRRPACVSTMATKPCTYVDPPYVHETRSMRTRAPAYRHEMDDLDHARLQECLRDLVGMVVVSGYRCDMYDTLFSGWRRVDVRTHADGARLRIESLLLSPNVRAPGLDLEAA